MNLIEILHPTTSWLFNPNVGRVYNDFKAYKPKRQKVFTHEPERTCTKCKETKPIEQYSINRSSRNGRNAVCKACKSALQSAYEKAKRRGVCLSTS